MSKDLGVALFDTETITQDNEHKVKQQRTRGAGH